VYTATKEALFADLGTSTVPLSVVTLNSEIVARAEQDPAYAQVLQACTHRTLDGSALELSFRIHHRLHRITEAVERYTGATMVHDLAAYAAAHKLRLALIGGNPGSAAAFAEILTSKYTDLLICAAEHGGVITDDGDPADLTLLPRLRDAKIDILLVGFGAPRQELFIARHGMGLYTTLAAGVGGSFNFGTTKPRAPLWMQKLRLEWLFRTITEPGHWKRVLKLLLPTLKFFWRVISSKLPAGGQWLSHSR
jgi:N-acetylglucosaminyldiphosphoundecaprenol N-acetyl-beta-D-mannosaminyltransferase